MALTEADIEQFIEALHNSADLRERARAAILSDDFQRLPAVVERLGLRIDQLAGLLDRLAQRMDRVEVQLSDLAASVKSMDGRLNSLDGRVGRLEGWQYEARYREHLASHLMRRFRKLKLLIPGNVPSLVEGSDHNLFSEAEWTQIIALDVLASATDISQPERPEVYVAIELSMVIHESDVERARERADILGRALDHPVVPCVDGEAILRDAELRAHELGVVNLRG